MSNVRISQLPNYSGNTSGSWLIMNNSGETTTYKVQRESLLSGMATQAGVTALSSSIASTDLSQNNRLTSIESITGSFAPSGNYATTGSNQFNGNQSISGSVNINGTSNLTGSLNVSGSINVDDSVHIGSSNIVNKRELWIQSGSNVAYQFLDVENINGNASHIMYASGSNNRSQIFLGNSFGSVNITKELSQLSIRGAPNHKVSIQYDTEVSGTLNVSGALKIGRTNSVGETVDLWIQSGSNVAYQTFGTFNNLTYHTLFASGSNGQAILALDNGLGTFSLIKTESQLDIGGPNSSHKVSIKNNTEITGSLRVTDIPSGSTSNQVVMYNTSTKQLERTINTNVGLKTKSYVINGTSGWTYPGSGSLRFYNLNFATPFSGNYAGNTMYTSGLGFSQYTNTEARYMNPTTSSVVLVVNDVPNASSSFVATFTEVGEN